MIRSLASRSIASTGPARFRGKLEMPCSSDALALDLDERIRFAPNVGSPIALSATSILNGNLLRSIFDDDS